MIDKLESKNAQDVFKARYKWWFLAVALICEIALMYNLQALYTIQVPIQKMFNLDEIKYSRIMTFESLPSVFVPIVAGMLADKYGTSIVFGVGMLVNYLGQFIATYSSDIFSYWLLIAGRVLVVSGFNITNVSRNKMFKNWFNNRQIATALSACNVIDYVGIILCDIGYPNIYERYDSLFASFIVGSALVVATAVFGIVQVILNARLLKFGNIENPHDVPESDKSFKNFPLAYWILVPCSVFGFLGYFGTKIYSSKFFQITFHFTGGEAGIMLAFAMAASGVITFFSGLYMDKYGKVNVASIFGACLIVFGTCIYIIFPHCFRCIMAVAPLVVISLGGAIIQLIVTVGTLRLIKSGSLGLAIALDNVLINILLMTYPIVGGYLSEKTIQEYGYFWVFIFNLMLGLICLMLAIWLTIVDRKGNKVLSVVMLSVRSSYAIVPDAGNQVINDVSNYEHFTSMQSALLVSEENTANE